MLFFLSVILANLFARWVSDLGILPNFMIETLHVLEYLLFGVDVFGLVVIILFEISSFVIELWAIRPWKQ